MRSCFYVWGHPLPLSLGILLFIAFEGSLKSSEACTQNANIPKKLLVFDVWIESVIRWSAEKVWQPFIDLMLGDSR